MFASTSRGQSLAPAEIHTTVPRPSLTTAVPKELVHRASVAEVMLTGWRRVSDTQFSITALWPQEHRGFIPAENGRTDLLIAAETIRQTGILLAHAEFDVPFGHQFLMGDIDVTAAAHARLPHPGDQPTALDTEVTVSQIKRQRSAVAGLHLRCVIRREGIVVATGDGSCSCLSPAVYRRIRGAAVSSADYRPPLTLPVRPRSVGRTSTADVVLSPAGTDNRWHLRVDTSHPVFFDHPVDHVPGMLLLEAARQAAASLLGRPDLPLTGIAVEFARYVELDAPCTIEARRLPRTARSTSRTVSVTGRQNGADSFGATVVTDAR
jgi:hypothetical protein